MILDELFEQRPCLLGQFDGSLARNEFLPRPPVTSSVVVVIEHG